MDKTLNIHTIEYGNPTCGPWPLGTELFVCGCDKRCPNCTNAELQDANYGRMFSVDEIFTAIDDWSKEHRKVTFCGGEPLLQHDALADLAIKLKEHGYTILVYTGDYYPDILDKYPGCERLLKTIDILVDGPYEQDKPSGSTYYGSTNQRVINMTETLDQKTLILYNEEGEN